MTEDSTPLVLIKGDATEEEVAALVAVLQGIASSGVAAEEPAQVSQWGSPHRKVRATYPHGPGGWRASALPR